MHRFLLKKNLVGPLFVATLPNQFNQGKAIQNCHAA